MKKNKIVKITVGTLIALLVITLMVLLTLSQRAVLPTVPSGFITTL